MPDDARVPDPARWDPSRLPDIRAASRSTDQPRPGLPSPARDPGSERVGRGLALAVLAIPAVMLLTVVISRLGFIAAISAFVLSALAGFLYRRGSGGLVRRGIPGLLALIIVGAVACFFSAVALDLVLYYGRQSAADQAALGSRSAFLRAELFDGPTLSSYGKAPALFLLFAGLGILDTLRRRVRERRSQS